MNKVYMWEVIAKNTPLLKKKCNHCDGEKFYCSEKFRMNAQKKNIDIWLIYRCVKCENTYNMTLFTRTKSELIDKKLFNKFLENDSGTAWDFAFSHESSRKNNLELDFGSVEFKIMNDEFSLEEFLNLDCDIAKIKINYPYDFNLKLSSIIRTSFNLSSSKLNKLIDENVISIKGKYFSKKHKVKNEDIIEVSLVKLRSFYHAWIYEKL